MTILDKLKFWKRDDPGLHDIPEPILPGEPELTPPTPGAPPGLEHLGMPSPIAGIHDMPTTPEHAAAPIGAPSIPEPMAAPAAQSISPDQQMQLISSKLDTIKAQLDTVLQRLDRLERKEQEQWRTNI